jgi:tripartite-type tricarboxylate transporter receptor subunit TctC
VVLVNPKGGIKSLADFVAWGKRSAKPLTYASSGLNSDGHKLATAFAKKVGINVVHVPYRAATQGILDLLGGHIDFAAINFIAALGQIRGGLLTAVAVAAKERTPELPDVPTFAESGYPGFAKRGTPGGFALTWPLPTAERSH